MARISANNYGSSLFTTLLLLTIRCNNGASPAEAFVTRYRSPLFMSKNNIGDSSSSSSNSNSNQIDTVGTSSSYADDKMGKSFLSVSTSPPPPLASTSSDTTTERSRTRQNNNISNNNNNNNVYRGKGRPTTMATATAEASTKTKTKTKKIAAPLVDSTLLRFLSAQKSQLAAENYEETTENTSYVRNGSDGNSSSNGKIVGNADSNGKSNGTTDTNSNLNSNNISSNGSTDTASADTTSLSNGKTDSSSIRSIVQIKNLMNETELIQSMTDNLMRSNNEDVDIDSKNTKSNRISPNNKNKQNINNNNTSTKKTTSSRVDDTTADSISWFTQYNAHNVAKKLIKLGATETEAEEAGNIVQNYSLTRTTRQRVRKFLSDRDSIWASASKQKESVDLNFQTSMRERNYNIDDIIEVLTDAGLTGKDIAAIFVHTPSVSMMKAKGDSDSTNADGSIDTLSNGGSLEDNLNRAYFGVLCSKIKLRKYDARKVLRTCPNLLTKRGSTSSEEVISILANLGVAPTSLCRDKSALPILLSRSPASLFRLVAFLSSDAVRMPVNRIGPLFRRSECASLLDHVAPLSQNLNSHSVDSLFNSGRNVMETEITRRYKMMFQTAKYLRREIDILDLGRSISAYPNILTLDIEKDISPCIDFLCEEVGLDEEDDVPSVLELYPQLLGENIDGMREKMTYLISLEVAEEDLGSIFRAFPALLTLDIASMKNVVDFLKGAGVTNIGRFVTRLPSVLGYSVEKDLLPKWRYLAKFSHQYASFEISRFPAYFSYPFDRVIKSRYEYLNMKQLPVQLLSIDEVLRYGDRDFATLVARDEDASLYATFAKERKKQQKKNSQSKKKPKKRKKDSSQ